MNIEFDFSICNQFNNDIKIYFRIGKKSYHIGSFKTKKEGIEFFMKNKCFIENELKNKNPIDVARKIRYGEDNIIKNNVERKTEVTIAGAKKIKNDVDRKTEVKNVNKVNKILYPSRIMKSGIGWCLVNGQQYKSIFFHKGEQYRIGNFQSKDECINFFKQHENYINEQLKTRKATEVAKEMRDIQDGTRMKRKSSKYHGVSWNNHAQKWCAFITMKSKCKHIGTFEYESQAAKARDDEVNNKTNYFRNLNFKTDDEYLKALEYEQKINE